MPRHTPRRLLILKRALSPHIIKRKIPVLTDSGANSPFSITPGGKNSSNPRATGLVFRQRAQLALHVRE